ncbi:MAG: polysaccharide deacetylase family protein [Spirochaetaceae bacterium]|jgi:peptidoglycan/xylan/chitin deacetylase (PgdA/CDA1 family)|nr:polysaccharide deacetylase family protein [Spirochaetaceae bacterium]
MFPYSTLKALTLSYDDGVEQDRKLVAILNRYQIKATFNLNSGIQSAAGGWDKAGIRIRRMNIKELPSLYAGHEIAVHSLTHPHLENLDADTVANELEQDKLNLERIFDTTVVGMAYPYGTYNQTVIDTARTCGLHYARGVVSTHSFAVPADLLTYQPTCHHDDPALLDLAEEFLRLKPETPQVFYLWGHSYEFEVNRNWQVLEDFCRLVAGHEDIYYATNAQSLIPASGSRVPPEQKAKA